MERNNQHQNDLRQNNTASEKGCCADGKIEESKASGCGCAPACCSDRDVEKSKQSGCGC